MHGGFGGRFGIMAAGPASGTPVTGAPYSAVETSQFQETLANGNQINRQNEAKVYRDSQGRVRMDRSFTPPGSTTAHTSVVIFDPVAGFVYILNPAKATAVKQPIPTPPPSSTESAGQTRRGPHAPAGATVTTDNLGTQVINGLSATGTRTTITIPAGAIGNSQPIQRLHEVWVSTDLKVPVLIKNTDPLSGNMVTQLTNVVRSEPDPTLFQIPSNYTVQTRTRGFGGPGPRGHRQLPPPQQE
jgi:hypothetical protein